jgi:hypothetical protein
MKKEAHAMGCQLTKSALKERTQEYWDKKPGYDCYINELLGRELQHAASQPDGATRLRGVGKPVHTLAFTVGESFEPLLQVVCVLRPKRVVLILNRHYGVARNRVSGSVQGKKLQDLIKQLHKVADIPDDIRPALIDDEKIVPRVLKQDTPTCVFRVLHEEMQKLEAQPSEAQPSEDFTNVVDITGAKKSMVVGAFLYAAHSGLPITYVDFDEYDTQRGKPYGYTCRIGEIANPYEAFHLRDWEQVRRLYESYSFRNARALLGEPATGGNSGTGILGAMSRTLGGDGGEPLFDKNDIERVMRLASLLEMYEAWENGDYAAAKRLRDSFNPPLPSEVVPWSVEELGDVWPATTGASDARTAADTLLRAHLALKQGASKPSDSLFAQPARLLAYIRDELAKIERLIVKNEDYRSAYLRAAGLHEFLLKARLALCWLNNVLEAKPTGASAWQPIATALGAAGNEAFASLMDESSEWKLRRTLQTTAPSEINVKGGNIRRSIAAPSLDPYSNGLLLDLATAVYTDAAGNSAPLFVRLRGEAIHTHLYIPRSVAEAALDLVRAAVTEFETNWLEHFHPGTLGRMADKLVEAPSWAQLCKVCELTFLPPRLRQ